MTVELKAGLAGALGIHALLLVGVTHWFQQNTFHVIAAPSSLEVALVTVKAPAKIAIQKELPKVTQEVKNKPAQKEKQEKQSSQQNLKTGALTEARAKEQYNEPPSYPRVARQRGYEGKLVVKVFISKQGLVEKAEVLQSSGYSVLDRSALESVKKWRFDPAQQFGVSVNSVLEVPFVFQLDEETGS